MNTENMIGILEEIFNEKNSHDLARKYSFIQRSSSKLKGHEFIKMMILPCQGVTTDSLKGMCKRMQEFNPNADLSAQALCERINDSSSVSLMKAVFAQVLSRAQSKCIEKNPQISQILNQFTSVLIEDSTVCGLSEKLAPQYAGTNRGATGPKSQVKIDLIYDILRGLIVDAKLYSGKTTDQGLAGRIITYISRGTLVIRDLGYFVLNTLKSIAVTGAYFLSRLLSNIKIYLGKELLDLGVYLRKHYSNYNIIEMQVLLGDEKVPSRLVIYRQPQEITNRRLREAKKRAKDTGRTMSQNKKLSLHFAMFVTNVPQELLRAELVGTIYRLRWEVELVFKRWKCQLEIDYLQGTHKNRIDSLIWGRLSMVILIGIINGYFAKIAMEVFRREISEGKLIGYLLRNNSLARAIKDHKLEMLLEEMIGDLPRMLCKDKRKRKTMRERILTNEPYYGIENIENQKIAA